MRRYILAALMLLIAAAIPIASQQQSNQPPAQPSPAPAQDAPPATGPGTAPATPPGTGVAPPQGTPAEGAAPAAPSSAAPASQAKPTVKPRSALAVVVLDPAHGGSDSGARGSTGGVESEIVLDFARAVRVTLEAQGFRVLLTREGNQGPSFDDRSAMVNGLRDAVFISLHVSSTGPPGTARAYSFVPLAITPASVVPSAQQLPGTPLRPQQSQGLHGSRSGLIEWDRAQQSYLDSSRRLAELVQIQLAQQFKGSPEVPPTAAVRQLRTIAAPAIAIEVSNVAAFNAQRLAQMGHPLAEAVARAVADYRTLTTRGTAASDGEQ